MKHHREAVAHKVVLALHDKEPLSIVQIMALTDLGQEQVYQCLKKLRSNGYVARFNDVENGGRDATYALASNVPPVTTNAIVDVVPILPTLPDDPFTDDDLDRMRKALIAHREILNRKIEEIEQIIRCRRAYREAYLAPFYPE